MHPDKHTWDRFNRNIVSEAAFNAVKNISNKSVVEDFKSDPDKYIDKVYFKLKYHKYEAIPYIHRWILNYNKRRLLSYTDLEHGIMMHTLLLLGEDRFFKSLIGHAYNCIPTYGINAKVKSHSLNHTIKRDVYENDYWGWCQLDMRKCYQSTNGKIVRKRIYEMYGKCYYSETLIKASVCEYGIPVGTAISPRTHHMVVRKLDYYCVHVLRVHNYRRYADDVRFQGDREELNQWSWRIRFYLYYECGYLVKDNLKIRPNRVACDIGGYVYHKTEITEGHHNKGYTRVRKSTKDRAVEKPSEPAYYGIFKFADSLNLCKARMDFEQLQDRMIIERELDSPEIDIEKVEGHRLLILGFDARPTREEKNKDGDLVIKKGWCKVQVAWRDPENKLKDARNVNIVKGVFPGIADSLCKVKQYMDELRDEGWSEGKIKKHIFPIRNIYFDFDGGWIIRGTNKQLTEYKED